MGFEHFLITRYNLNFRNWKQDKNGKEIRTKYWLKQRDVLFKRYCQPSVFNQKNQNFKWLVLTDAFGPKFEFDPKITELRLDSVSWLGGLQRWLKRNCKKDFIITTRLDNDDSLHERVTDDIQICFDRQENEYLNLYNGYLIHGHKVYKTNHRCNQFLSRIEKADTLKTVYETTHGGAMKQGPVRQLTDRRYWARIVHHRNMIRDNLGASEYCGKLKLKGFGW